MFMKKNRSLNLKYAGSQIFYFAAFASMMGYASVFLLDKGCTNSQIGIALALSSIIAVLLQPMLASFADNHKNIEMRNIIAPIVLLVIALSAILYLIPGSALFVLFLVVTIFSIMSSIMPLMNTLAFVFEQHGIEINYGLARGLGSVAYAIASLVDDDKLSVDYILPYAFDERIKDTVAKAVADAAVKDGVARI